MFSKNPLIAIIITKIVIRTNVVIYLNTIKNTLKIAIIKEDEL